MVDREKQLEEMIAFAKVDGKFCDAEMNLIATVAERLGFSKLELDTLIKEDNSRQQK